MDSEPVGFGRYTGGEVSVDGLEQRHVAYYLQWAMCGDRC